MRETVKQCFRHCLGLATGVTTTYSYRTRRIKQEWQCVTIHPEQPSHTITNINNKARVFRPSIAPGCAAGTNLLRSFVCLTCVYHAPKDAGNVRLVMASWRHEFVTLKCLENQGQSEFFGKYVKLIKIVFKGYFKGLYIYESKRRDLSHALRDLTYHGSSDPAAMIAFFR